MCKCTQVQSRYPREFSRLCNMYLWDWHTLFFLSFIYFTSFGEKDKADMNSLRWSAPVGLEPAYTRMWVPALPLCYGRRRTLFYGLIQRIKPQIFLNTLATCSHFNIKGTGFISLLLSSDCWKFGVNAIQLCTFKCSQQAYGNHIDQICLLRYVCYLTESTYVVVNSVLV